MEPVPVKREDLLILWTVRPHKKENVLTDVVQMRGRVYYKDDPVLDKPRILAEVLIPKELAAKATMEQMIALAEERAQLDLDEIAHTGVFADYDGPDEPGLDVLRKSMAR